MGFLRFTLYLNIRFYKALARHLAYLFTRHDTVHAHDMAPVSLAELEPMPGMKERRKVNLVGGHPWRRSTDAILRAAS